MAALLLFILPLFFTHCSSMTTISALTKDQIACTMCSSCDNPCEPILSPPPPSPPPPVLCPPPPPPPVLCPPPPPPAGPECPPPPAPPSAGPPPQLLPLNYPPPYGGGEFYQPQNPNFPTPPPPNPIVSYFPFYFHTPPAPSSHTDDYSDSVKIKSHHFVSSIVIMISTLFFL